MIPNAVVYPATVLAETLAPFLADRSTLNATGGGTTAFAAMLVVFMRSRGGLGGGDVKMAALVGTVVGYPAVFGALLTAAISFGVTGVALLSVRTLGLRDSLPLGPFLAAGALAALR